MVLKIQFPEPVGQEILELPDRDEFVSSVVAQALETRRAEEIERSLRGHRRMPSEVRDHQLPPLNDRKREDTWRRANRGFLQDRFAGQWVVLEGEEIVAHSEDPAQAVGQARAKGVAVPFVFRVEPPRRPGVVQIGL